MSATALTALIARCRVLCRPRSQAADAELLQQFAQRRDADAFEQLLERHAVLVWGVCRRILPSEADCEDAFQATFLALVRRAGAVKAKPSLAPWLHTVAVRVARKALARSRRQRTQTALPELRTPGDVVDDVASRELFGMVDEEIERLPAALRLPIILCCLQGRTRDEAAEVLGCSVSAVKGRLERGRDLLRHRLQQRGVQLPAAFLALSLTSTRIRACLWAKTMQAALYTPAPAIVALAEAALPALTVGKGKLFVAVLLLAASTAGMAGSLLTTKKPQTPAAISFPAQAAAEPKKSAIPQVRRDRHGDPLPDGAMARLGTVRWQHGFMVQALAYSPDGKKIVSCRGGDRALVLWDAATGKELRVFPKRSQVRSIAFSPDGKWIGITHRKGEVWDAASGKMVCELKNPIMGVSAIAFAPNGKTLATANVDGAVHLWDPTSGEEKSRLKGGQGGVNAVAYSPDGTQLASGGEDGVVRLWNATTGKEIRRLTNPKKDIRCIVFSPDSKQLAVWSNEDSLRLWDVATGRQIHTLGETQQLFAPLPLAFSPDGKLLASASLDGTLNLWDAASGESRRHWRVGSVGGFSLAFSPDGQTLATAMGYDSDIRLWDAATGRERHPSEGHHGPVRLLRFAADKETLVSAGFDRRVLWWDVPTQRPRRQFAWTTGNFLTAFALSADDNILAVGNWRAHEVGLWDIRSGKATKLPGKHENHILSVAISPDGRLVASAGLDQTIHIWNVREGKEVSRIKGFTNAVEFLCFSPDGKALACGSSPRRKVVKDEATLRLWDVSSGKERCTFDSHIAVGFALAFSPDGKMLASGNEYAAGEAPVRLWDATTGKALGRYTGHQQSAGSVAFSPDGKLVVSGNGKEGYLGDSSVHVWEAATGRLIRRFDGHHSWVWAVTFSADGLTVASGAGDSTILLWDITGRQKDGKLPAVALTPRQLDACWTALANEDAAKAYDAVWSFVSADEQAVPYLQKHLPPIPRPDAKVVARLIADLDSNDFAVRDKATKELGKLGDTAAPALRQALGSKPSLEMRRRLQQLLDQSRDWTAERLRAHRAIQVLEHIGTPSAKKVLQALADGAPQARRTDQAKAALGRMAH